MNKNTIVLILSIAITIISAAILAVGPITNKKIGANWGIQNCGLINDQLDTLTYDSEKLKDMKYLCRRQTAMYDLEYCAFIVNVVVGIICADLALLEYMGIARDFEVKEGVIACAGGFIGFVLSLVYVCYSGYMFTNDTAYLELNFNYGNLDYIKTNTIEKLYSNGASQKWDGNANAYVNDYDSSRDSFAGFIKYKDLGKSQYNYDSDYYKKFRGYIDTSNEIYKCQENRYDSSCEYLYHEPATESTNKELYDRWLTALILACVATLCNLLLALFGVFLFANFGNSFLN